MPRKPRDIANPLIPQNAPAWRVIVERWGGLGPFCADCEIASSTAYDWLLAGLIPANRQARIRGVAIRRGIELPAGIFEPEAARG